MALHTDVPSRRQIERLLQARGDGLVSIYLPTSPITPEADASRIAFKNLAATAVAEVREAGLGTAEREAIEEALDDLHDDEELWALQAHSLAVFADPNGLRSFRLPNRLTEAVQVAVEALLADVDTKLPGTIAEESGVASLDDGDQAGDYGVVDELCRRVILAGGTVLAVRAADVPGGGPAAAILRYPV